ncbi:V-type H+-transporting ATPase subunit E [Nematocida sp. AWRm80]|nr:V-type H+-transporting ATPase subunit E [Nematocida sp. AWRm80]
MPVRAANASERGARRSNMEVWDMGRMLRFIEQESEQKAHEIRIKANEEYSVDIAELAVQSQKKVEQQKREEIAKIRAEKTIAEGKLRFSASIALSKEKDLAVRKIMTRVAEECKTQPLSESIIKYSVSKFRQILPETEMIIYAMDKDIEIIRSTLSNEKYTLEPMHSTLLGGIVIRDPQRIVLINNSYLERLKETEQKIMPILRKVLFPTNPTIPQTNSTTQTTNPITDTQSNPTQEE